jgi:hypothetical protein
MKFKLSKKAAKHLNLVLWKLMDEDEDVYSEFMELSDQIMWKYGSPSDESLSRVTAHTSELLYGTRTRITIGAK